MQLKYYWNNCNVRELLPVIVDVIKKISEPEKIILFGSYAERKENTDSDIDLIVIEKNITSKRKESVRIRRALKNFIIPMDIIVATEKEYDFYKNEIGSVFRDAELKGILLYEKTI
jgi:predicted nucleotidyltransferase